jgi:hypothetical protein
MEKKENEVATEDEKVTEETEEVEDKKVDSKEEYMKWLKSVVVSVIKQGGPTISSIVTANVLAAGIDWEQDKPSLVALIAAKFEEVKAEVEGVMEDLEKQGILVKKMARPISDEEDKKESDG